MQSTQTKVVIGLLFAIFIVLLYSLGFGKSGYLALGVLHDQVLQEKAKVAHLQQENRVLAAQIQDLKSSTHAVEAIARHDLGMVRKGESYFRTA